MSELVISLLGPLRVWLASEPVTGFCSDKARALLAYLAVEEGISHRREELAGLLWPGYPERSARQSLSQALFSLRSALRLSADDAPRLLLATRQELQLAPSPQVSIDASAFGALLQACSQHPHDDRGAGRCDECVARLQQVIELYGGEFLAGFTLADCSEFEEWLVVQRERYRRQAVEALRALVDGHSERPLLPLSLAYARRWAELEPLDEEAHRAVMRLLAMLGQRSAALAQFERCCQLLAQDLQLAPEPATCQLAAGIRSGEPPVGTAG